MNIVGTKRIMAILGLASFVSLTSGQAEQPHVNPNLVDRQFIIRALGNRCFDAGDPARSTMYTPVVIKACRAQSFRVKEIAEAYPVSHDFVLMIPGSSHCLGVSGRTVAIGHALEVQECTGASRQRFAFDGKFLNNGVEITARKSSSYAPSASPKWFVSKSGRQSFAVLRNAALPQFLPALPIGHFDEVAGADVLFWDSLHFRIASGGKITALWSRQSMR